MPRSQRIRRFQSTQPEWAATEALGLEKPFHLIFQSTQPEWAATGHRLTPRPCLPISIHAARMGCDQNAPSFSFGYIRHFNPRSPNGLRLYAKRSAPRFPSYFNPRSPNGLRQSSKSFGKRAIYFNPRSPNGLRQWLKMLKGIDVSISIHAARMGCDTLLRPFRYCKYISIHAARMGCDSIRINCNYYLFYSYKSAKLTFLLN